MPISCLRYSLRWQNASRFYKLFSLDIAEKICMGRRMKTTKDIIAAIGVKRVQEMMDVSSQSIYRVNSDNKFPASWFRAICQEMDSLRLPWPAMDLFSFKVRDPHRNVSAADQE